MSWLRMHLQSPALLRMRGIATEDGRFPLELVQLVRVLGAMQRSTVGFGAEGECSDTDGHYGIRLAVPVLMV